MGLPHLSVRRPVTAMMICVGAVLLGIISWLRLPQELFPPITYPQISIVTFYKDAAPEEIEILITKLIEEQVGTVSGVRRISSTSEEERSLVIAEFNWDTHMDFAALNVREKIDLVKERLPRGSDDSIVVKYNPFELPVMVLNVTGNLSPQDLLHMTRKVVKSEIEKVEGVAAATLSGGVEREILVELDQGRLIATGTSVTNVVDALANANLNYPAGTIKETFYEQLIRTIGEFGLVEEVGELSVSVDEGKSPFEPDLYEGLSEEKADVLREENKKLILIKDVGKVYDTTKERTSISRHNGLENISISIQKKATANTVKTCDRIREVILALREDLSKDIRISIAYDQSEFVRQSLNGVMTSGLQGGVLAFLVLLVFLRSIRAAAVVAITIPVSVLITFSGMYFFGVTLNIISLGGLALGIGMLVDNGIVVIENIIRKQQEKKLSDVASIQGASEVSGAITSSTLTTVTVFVPMIFVIGIAGQLFKELAFTVIFSLAASLGVALIFIPPVMRKMLDHEKGNQASGSQETRFWTDVQAFFSKTLALFLRFKFLGVLFALVLFMFSLYVSRFLDREFLPRVDQGQFVLKVDMLPGTKLEITDSITTLIESKLSIMPEISDVTVNIGSAREKGAGNLLETLDEHQAQILVSLVPKADRWRSAREGERTRSTQEVIQELKKALQTEHLLGAEIEYVAQESVFQSALVAGKPIVVEITGSELAILERLAKEMQEKLEQIRGVYGVKSSQSPGSPETKVHILKDRASAYRLSTSDIALTAQTAIKGYTATEYKEEGREIDLLVRLREEDRDSLNKVRNLTIHSPLGVDVPLSEVAYLAIGKGPTDIKRQAQQRVILVSADIYGRTLSRVTGEVEEALIALDVPEHYEARLTGESEETRQSFKSLLFALILSVVLVYMIMAAQFESLWQPFVIMFTFPLSIIGVTAALLLTQTPLSVMVILGIIVLGGIVVNNGIVLIDQVNRLKLEKTISSEQAVLEASTLRLRPILMTTATTVLGLLPLAMGLNQGAELQVPMAIAVMGGLLVSTFLSLVVVPSIYLIMDQIISFFKRGRRRLVPAGMQERLLLPAGVSPRAVDVSYGKASLEPEKEAPPILLEGPVLKEPASEQPLPTPEDPSAYLNPRQQQFLEDLKSTQRLTRLEYAERYHVSIPTAARDIKELLTRRLIIGHGPLARGRYYTRVKPNE